MAETEVASPPQLPVEEHTGKGRPERPRREPEDVPDMSVEEAHKALNALPKPEPQPENEEHEQQVAAINEDIKKIKARIEVLKDKIDEAQKDRGVQMKEMDEARNVMRELKEERDGIRAQLNAMQEVTKSAKATLEGHDKSKRALQSSLKYRTVEEIEQAIKKMEIRQQTSSMSLAEEKKLVKEIEQLKQSKKTAAQYVSQEEALGKAKDGYNATRKTESEKKAELKVVQDKIKLAHSRLEELNKTKEEEGEGVNALYEEKKALHEEINDKIEEIKELRKAHTAKLDAWYALRRERAKLKRALQKAEWMERLAAKEARNKAIEEEEARKIPYESEMVLCDTLVSYLETTFLKGEPVKPTAATPAPMCAASAEFGGVKMVMKKRQDEDFIVMGGGKKRGGGKKKAGGKNAPGGRHTIVHAIDTMESFSLLSIAPPPNKAAVPDAIKALKDKKAWFKEQPRPTPVKQAQAADKGPKKQAPKVKPPDINDAEFPGLPGMIIKPKAEDTPAPAEAEGDGDVEKANGDAGEEEEKALCDKPEVEAPSAASVVANGVSGKAGGSYPKVEPKNVPEEADGGKQEVDAGGNTAADEEAGDKVEKSDGGAEANEGGGKGEGEACDVKGGVVTEAKEDGDGEEHGEGGKEEPDVVTPEAVQNGEEGGVEKAEAGGHAGGDGDEE